MRKKVVLIVQVHFDISSGENREMITKYILECV